jgi:hypothetical protein
VSAYAPVAVQDPNILHFAVNAFDAAYCGITVEPRCPACDGQMPDRDRGRGGRKARYCSGACRAKAYRARRQAGGFAASDSPPLPAAARHARAVEIRQQASDLIGTLADTASGQQALFASPGSAAAPGPPRPPGSCTA